MIHVAGHEKELQVKGYKVKGGLAFLRRSAPFSVSAGETNAFYVTDAPSSYIRILACGGP